MPNGLPFRFSNPKAGSLGRASSRGSHPLAGEEGSMARTWARYSPVFSSYSARLTETDVQPLSKSQARRRNLRDAHGGSVASPSPG